jgi:DNA-directed RNA polymerase beta subunit
MEVAQSAHLAEHHLASFHHYCYTEIPRILKQPVQTDEGEVYLGGKQGELIRFVPPTQFPNEARLRNTTYSFRLFAGEVDLGSFPLMVNSSLCLLHNVPRAARSALGECRNDPGGYFIINGKEVVLTPKVVRAETVVHRNPQSAQFKNIKVETLAETETETRGQIVVHIPKVRAPIPLFIVMRALGVVSDKAIVQLCLLDMTDELANYFIPSVHDAGKIFTQAAALIYLSLFVKGRSQAKVLLILNEAFPGKAKAHILGNMVQQMVLSALGIQPSSDPNSWANKRVVSSGAQLAEKFAEAFAKYRLKEFHPFQNITTRLPRTSFLAMVGCLRALEPAPPHLTQWGVLDPLDKTQLAVMARITVGVPGQKVVDSVKELLSEVGTGIKVVVNGVWTAGTTTPAHLMHVLLEQRRNGERKFWDEVNFGWAVMEGCISICTDAGRLQWPLFYVSDGVVSDMYEYLDAMEANTAYIAQNRGELKERHTHVEVHGSFLLGAIGNAVVFPEHNASPRTTLACAQLRAAVSLPHTNHTNRIDPETYVLQNGQEPLLKSAYWDQFTKGDHPNGVNVMLAVMACGSADSVVLNQAAVDRGMFHVTKYAGYEVDEDGAFEATEPHLDANGLAKEGTVLSGNMAVVGRAGGSVHHRGDGVVDRVYMTSGPRGKRLAKVRVRVALPVQVGDTFASRSGQKGACGALWREQDMPFTRDGLRPDVILNPQAIADHMGLGQILEALFGKAHLVQGTFGDGTAFAGNKVADYSAVLKKYGLNADGNEVLYDGTSGNVLDGNIFLGPTYYMRFPPTEAHCRARGAVEAVTRQPLEGVFVGEPERDALVAHGMTQSVRDAYMTRGDGSTIQVDAVTGALALQNKEMGVTLAPGLDGPIAFDGGMRLDSHRVFENKFTTMRVPHAFKALMQELTALNVQMRLVGQQVRMNEEVVDTVHEQFRNMPLDTPDQLDNELYVDDNAYVAFSNPRLENVIFPFVTDKEELMKLMATSFSIKPTAGHVSRHNKDKLEDPMYDKMNVWDSARLTSLYMFTKARTAVFVRVKDNKVHNFIPFFNLDYTNDFSARLSLDGKKAATSEALLQYKAPPAQHWHANNCVLGTKAKPSDAHLAEMYDLVVETCSHRKVGDCMFFMNQNSPLLGCNWTEGFESVYGEAAPLDKRWRVKESAARPFLPVLSQCTSAAHADIPIPTAMDWDSITQKKFATCKGGFNGEGGVRSKNEAPNVKYTEWEQRTGTIKWKGGELPIFYWRGQGTGCGDTVETNPRINVNYLSGKYAPDAENETQNPLQTGILDARITRYTPRIKAAAAGKLTKVTFFPAEDLTKEVPLEEQARKFRFTLNIEGNAAAYRYGSLFKYGFCVLNVKSKYQLWFERLTGYDGKPLLVGGPITADDVEKFAYLEIEPDLANLTDTMKWCLENEETCKKVAENGMNFYKRYFTKEFVYDYMSDVLNGVSAKFTEAQSDADAKVQQEELKKYKRDVRTKWTEYAAVPNTVLNKTVVVIPYKDDAKQLNEWLRQPQHKGLNILVVHALDGFNRGALMNVGYDYVKRHAPEITDFVMQDVDSIFPADYVKDFYGSDGKGVVWLGGNTLRFNKETYKKVNGFPNTVAEGEFDLLSARLNWGMVEAFRPIDFKKEKTAKAAEEDLVLDRMNWKMNGANSIQYRVVEHVLLNKSPHIRKISVRLAPDASLREIEIRDPKPALVEKLPDEAEPASDEPAETAEPPAVEPEKPADWEMVDSPVVNIIDGDGIKLETMPVLGNETSLDSSVSNIKTVQFTEK